jgi:hypothetical protein
MNKRKCESVLNNVKGENGVILLFFSNASATYVKIKKLNWRYIDEVNN